MKKVLFIMQSYPSERSANVDCDEKIINELRKHSDIEIYCLTYRYNYQPLKSQYDGFTVYRYKKGVLFDLYSWARHHENIIIGRVLLKIFRFLLLAKELILVPFYPYIEPLGMRQCVTAAIDLHKKIHFDLVFADHNGIDTLYAGKKLKEKFPEIRFIAMMWDPILGKNKPKYVSSQYHTQRCLKAQNNLIYSADLIIMLDSVKDLYVRHSHQFDYFERIRFCSIPGIIRPEDSTNQLPEDVVKLFEQNKYNIVYTGLITVDRNPLQLIKILDLSEFSNRINIVFFCSKDGEDIIKTIQPNEVTIRIHNYVDKSVLRGVYNRANCFLNLGGSEANMVPSKLFNYLSYGKPIISTYIVEEDPSAKCLRSYPLACCVNLKTDIMDNLKQVNDFIDHKMTQSYEFEKIKKLYRNSTPSIYTDLIIEQMREVDLNGQGA